MRACVVVCVCTACFSVLIDMCVCVCVCDVCVCVYVHVVCAYRLFERILIQLKQHFQRDECILMLRVVCEFHSITCRMSHVMCAMFIIEV